MGKGSLGWGQPGSTVEFADVDGNEFVLVQSAIMSYIKLGLMATKKSKIRLVKNPVMTISRQALRQQKTVYILVANKPLYYKWKRKSRIIYIGTTKMGVSRIGQSVVARGEPALGKHGIRRIDAYVAKCRPRKAVEIWKKLESAFLQAFKRYYGLVPYYNKQYKDRPVTDEFKFFREDRLVKILAEFDS